MNQSGQSLRGADLGTLLDSAANGLDKGQQQFFTPKSLASALMTPLARGHDWILDPHCGSGHLLTASGVPHRYGLDLDRRSTRRPQTSEEDVHYHLGHVDFTHWFPIAAEAGFHADLITLNPPFSLRWHAERFAPLADSRLPNVRQAFKDWTSRSKSPARHSSQSDGGTIDSTAVSLLSALDLLTPAGEGFLIGNQDTLSRLLGDPAGPASHPVRNHIWCWLTLPAVPFEGIQTRFPVAVLYFAAGHIGTQPLHLTAPSAEPETVRQLLGNAASMRRLAFRGTSLDSSYLSSHSAQEEAWHAILEEYAHRHLDRPRGLNLWLDEHTGRIRTHLDTFSACRLDHSVIDGLQSLRGKLPAQLVVQHASRAALQDTLRSGTWHVCPRLLAAVEQATADYNAVRAPFYTPNPVMALGWIDEVDHITARTSRLHGIREGQHYKLRTFTEELAIPGEKTNLAGEKEALTLRSQELVIEINGSERHVHRFHVRRTQDAPEREEGDGLTIHHHLIAAFNQHFETPIPPDVAQTNPGLYQHNKAILKQLEARINRRLAATP